MEKVRQEVVVEVLTPAGAQKAVLAVDGVEGRAKEQGEGKRWEKRER